MAAISSGVGIARAQLVALSITMPVASPPRSRSSTFSARNGPAAGAAYMVTIPGSPAASVHVWKDSSSASVPSPVASATAAAIRGVSASTTQSPPTTSTPGICAPSPSQEIRLSRPSTARSASVVCRTNTGTGSPSSSTTATAPRSPSQGSTSSL